MVVAIPGQRVFHLNVSGTVPSIVLVELGKVYRSPLARLHASCQLSVSSPSCMTVKLC